MDERLLQVREFQGQGFQTMLYFGGWSQLAVRARLQALHGALEAGGDVHGCFAWTVLDNFEWERGYGPRFGLVRVDYESLERIPKQSACWFKEVIDQNAVTL